MRTRRTAEQLSDSLGVWPESRHLVTDRDRELAVELVALDKTPAAIERFAQVCHELSDYSYWFILGTLWVSYTGGSELALWRRLFEAPRRNRQRWLMKPGELQVLRSVARDQAAVVWRAHRHHETDWLSYSTSHEKAASFAARRGVHLVHGYELKRRHVLALFLRRGERELLVLDREAPVPIGAFALVDTDHRPDGIERVLTPANRAELRAGKCTAVFDPDQRFVSGAANEWSALVHKATGTTTLDDDTAIRDRSSVPSAGRCLPVQPERASHRTLDVAANQPRPTTTSSRQVGTDDTLDPAERGGDHA